MSEAWKKTSIGACLNASFSGEWGLEPEPANALVFRATDIDDEGRIVGGGVERRLPIGKLTAKRLHEGDILLEGSGGGPGKPVGRVAYFEGVTGQESSVCSNFFKTLRPNRSEVDPRFLLRKLSWFYKQPTLLTLQQQTTGIINLKFEEYLSASIEIPKTIDEQQKIAQVLDTLDTAIHETETIIAKLIAIKQGLLHDLLTRGIDANGKLRPTHAEAPHLYKDSPLGWIPKEWGCVQLADKLAVRGGKRLPAGHDYSSHPTAYKYLRVTDFVEREYSHSELESLHERTFTVLERYEIQPGQLFISIAGTIGYIGVHRQDAADDVRTILTENAARLIPLCEQFPEFVAAYMNSEMVQRQVAVEKGTGGGVPKLALFRIEKFWLAWPDLDEQEAIVLRLNAIDLRIRNEEQLLRKRELEKLGLMDDLLTGRIRVTPLLTEAQVHLGDA